MQSTRTHTHTCVHLRLRQLSESVFQVPPSVWDRVQSVAEGALEMLLDNRNDLEPVFREMDSAEVSDRRRPYPRRYIVGWGRVGSALHPVHFLLNVAD